MNREYSRVVAESVTAGMERVAPLPESMTNEEWLAAWDRLNEDLSAVLARGHQLANYGRSTNLPLPIEQLRVWTALFQMWGLV